MVFTLTAILISSIGVTPAFAQEDPITVSTDKSSYAEGDTIMISGVVKDLIGQGLSIVITSSNGNRVAIAQVDVSDDKTFSTEITAGGPLMKFDGTYTVTVTYGGLQRTAETTFDFSGAGVGPGGGPSGPTIDVGGTLVSYKITGGTLDAIQEDFDSKSLIISITATDDGNLTIILPRNVIDAIFNGGDDDFFVLVDAQEVDFDETETTDTHRTLSIDFNAGSEEIEIIGTFVIPEFGAIAALILAVAIISIIAVSAKTRLSLIPRY